MSRKEILKIMVLAVFCVLVFMPFLYLSDATLFNGVSGWILAFLAVDRLRSWLDKLYNYLNK